MKTFLIAAAAALILPGAASASSAADLTGNWRLVVTAGDMTFSIDCSMVEKGPALSGSCTPVGVDGAQPSSFTGRVKDTTAIWAYDVETDGPPMHLNYAASIRSATSMVGAIIQGDSTVAFTATKAVPGAPDAAAAPVTTAVP